MILFILISLCDFVKFECGIISNFDSPDLFGVFCQYDDQIWKDISNNRDTDFTGDCFNVIPVGFITR